MRNFIIDIWVWNRSKHSRPLKSIRFELNHFPNDEECEEVMNKDEDVQFYLNNNAEVNFTNLREYEID